MFVRLAFGFERLKSKDLKKDCQYKLLDMNSNNKRLMDLSVFAPTKKLVL
jgi:hypothetical protein